MPRKGKTADGKQLPTTSRGDSLDMNRPRARPMPVTPQPDFLVDKKPWDACKRVGDPDDD
jgi:hypothetical protein